MKPDQRQAAVDDLLKYCRDPGRELTAGLELSAALGVQRANDDDDAVRLAEALAHLLDAEIDQLRRKMRVGLGSELAALPVEEQFRADRETQNQHLELLSLVKAHYIEHIALDKLARIYDRSEKTVEINLRRGRKIVAELLIRGQVALAQPSEPSDRSAQQQSKVPDIPPQHAVIPRWSADHLRNRRVLIQKVRQSWIESYLKGALYGMTLLGIGKEQLPEVVAHPWEMIVQWPDQSTESLLLDRQMIEIFDELGGKLLILGAAGAGKTTTLLELARDLLQRAEAVAEYPIPVVFHLGAWTNQQPLTDWLIAELALRYEVPRAIGAGLIAEGQLLPLLDGLDEVKPTYRAACVATINAFHRDYSLKQLVVCSRSADYRHLGARLELQAAIELQALTDHQIHDYLAQHGAQVAHLQHLLEADPELRELVQTPLLLNVFILAYQDSAPGSTLGSASPDEQRRQLFDTYIHRMLSRRGPPARYTQQQTIQWLAWLAHRMSRHDQPIFHLERMQPDWLSPQQRRRYVRRVRLIRGILAGGACSGWMPFALLMVPLITAWPFGTAWMTPDTLLLLTVGSIILGSVAGGVAGLSSTTKVPRERIDMFERFDWSRTRRRSALIVGVLFSGLLTPIIGSEFGMGSGLLIGTSVGVSFGILLLTLGLPYAEIEERTAPNQGTWRSLTHALAIGVLISLASGVPVGVLIGIIAGPAFGQVLGITIGASLGLLMLLVFGGEAFLKHWLLRITLSRQHQIPWRYVDFLDFASQHILIQRVGGGYVFIHRFIQEHFAALDGEEPPEAERA